ncbi:hypothetical protein R3P38DRAFT_2872779 [Favolaschia claudopus]|uniref:F-box domain-containing protein n=1 Tax=Favolaschia claudopus TaxID=2862362 RepID=A0AAW0D9W1_9AGAR
MSNALNVTKLLKRIDELSDTIKAQNKVLMDLKEQRRSTRRKLNNFRDPMARLPLEIQSQIFLDVEGNACDLPQSSEAPMNFLRICQLWRAIALATPQLWSSLRIQWLPCKASYIKFCDYWIERSSPLPFSLYLKGELQLTTQMQDLMTRHRDRLQDLTLELVGELTEESALTRQILVTGPFLSLQTLEIRTEDEMYFRTVNEWVDLLAAAPALTKCTLDNMYVEWEDWGHNGFPEPLPARPLLHTSLRELRLGDVNHYAAWLDHGSSAAMLLYLTLPALQTLHFTHFDITHKEFRSFMARSWTSPPLRSLSMVVERETSVSGMATWLRSMSSLTNLSLFMMSSYNRSSSSERILELLEALDGILPALHTLTISMNSGEEFDYRRLARFLHTRRTGQQTPLATFRLYITPRSGGRFTDLELNDDVLGPFRPLAEDGLDVHIGLEGQNLLV